MFSLIWAWINGWVNNHEAGDLRRQRAQYDVTVIISIISSSSSIIIISIVNIIISIIIIIGIIIVISVIVITILRETAEDAY